MFKSSSAALTLYAPYVILIQATGPAHLERKHCNPFLFKISNSMPASFGPYNLIMCRVCDKPAARPRIYSNNKIPFAGHTPC